MPERTDQDHYREVLDGLRNCLVTTSYDCPGKPVQCAKLSADTP